MDVHPTKNVSIGIDPYPYFKPPTSQYHRMGMNREILQESAESSKIFHAKKNMNKDPKKKEWDSSLGQTHGVQKKPRPEHFAVLEPLFAIKYISKYEWIWVVVDILMMAILYTFLNYNVVKQ